MRKHLVDGVLMRARSLCDFVTEGASLATKKLRRTDRRIVAGIRKEDSGKRSIIIRRPLKGIVFALVTVMLSQGHLNIGQLFNPIERLVERLLSGKSSHDSIDVLQLLKRGPAC